MRDGHGGLAEERHSNRREVLASSLKLIAAGAIVAAGTLAPAHVAAQDEGIGAGGRQGGDGDGGGRRRRQEGDQAAEGVGSGGRSATLPTVNGMPKTGVGVMDSGAGGVAPLLLAAGAVGAATMAMKTRATAAAHPDIS